MRTSKQLDRLRSENMEHYGFGPAVMKKMKVCQNCGAVAWADQQFCKECGKRLPKVTLYQRYREKHRCCPVCENVVADTMQYCPQCGTQIKERKGL